MRIDNPEHQKLLLELLNAARYEGTAVKLVAQVMQAVEDADIGPANPEPVPTE